MSDLIDTKAFRDLSPRRNYEYKKTIFDEDELEDFSTHDDIIMFISDKVGSVSVLTISKLTGEITTSGVNNSELNLSMTEAQTDAVTEGIKSYDIFFVNAGINSLFTSGRIQFKNAQLSS